MTKSNFKSFKKSNLLNYFKGNKSYGQMAVTVFAKEMAVAVFTKTDGAQCQGVSNSQALSFWSR